jgi:RimJ/RimL family protein N-acetyltransferase
MVVTASAAAAPLLVTERLELWLPRKEDIAPMSAIVSDPATGRFLAPQGGAAGHFQRFCRNAGSWLLYGYGAFMVRERGSGALLGNCGVFHSVRGLGDDFDDAPEAGWILRRDKVGQGLAQEAMRAVLVWFEREHGPQRIVCMISLGNEPSMRLAAKLGFAPLRETTLPEGDAVRLFERRVERH